MGCSQRNEKTEPLKLKRRSGSHNSLSGVTGPDNDQDQTTTTPFGRSRSDHPGLDNDHTIWSFSGPEILGPHNDVGKIVRSLSGPETPDSVDTSFLSGAHGEG